MPVTYSNRLKEILGIPDSPTQGLSVQTQAGLIQLEKESQPTPTPVPTISPTQGGSFKEDYIKHFGQSAWDKKVLEHEAQKQKLLDKRK